MKSSANFSSVSASKSAIVVAIRPLSFPDTEIPLIFDSEGGKAILNTVIRFETCIQHLCAVYYVMLDVRPILIRGQAITLTGFTPLPLPSPIPVAARKGLELCVCIFVVVVLRYREGT